MKKGIRERIQEQIVLQFEMQKNGINLVDCGHCGSTFLHKTPVDTITCPYCNSEMDISDCPDHFYDGLDESSSWDEIEEKEKEEEKTIPLSYGVIKVTCGWSKFCDVTGNNHYAINEFGDFEEKHNFYVSKTQLSQLGLK